MRYAAVIHLCTTALLLASPGCGPDDGDDAADTSPLDTSASSSMNDSDTTGDDDAPPQGTGVGTSTSDDAATVSDGDDENADDEASAGEVDDTGDAPPAQLPPTDGAALLPWLEAAEYTAWSAESGPHASAGPHGSGGVRTFVNAALFASLDAGNAEHPIDAAVVKELYAGDGSIAGWAVMVKVAAGQGGASWYWYELVGSSTYADGIDVGLCTGCHADGTDQVLTPYPLQ